MKIRDELTESAERLRKARGDTSPEAVCKAVGICAESLWMYELGVRTPGREVRRKLAEFYHVPEGYLFFAANAT